MTDRKLTLTDPESGKTLDLPVVAGTEGDPTMDITRLNREMGYFTYDPGYGTTANCKSDITFIDGTEGILRYRGYPIEQLADRSSFMEVAYLLLFGELPSAQELTDFQRDITYHTMVHEQVNTFIAGFHYDAHPMAILSGVVASMAGFYQQNLDVNDPEHRVLAAKRLIAKMPTVAAAAYRHSMGWPSAYPRNSLNYPENFLHMMFSVPAEAYEINPIAARALDLLFILHADHEQNASTSTVRLVGSTGANPYACVAAGIAALWGPAHGGANEAVLRMLNQIGDVSRVGEFIKRAKDKDDPFRLMGFGHRVYKNFDPRATVMKQSADEVLGLLGVEDNETLKIAKELERIALEDEYFVDKKLYPNVDFYSGIILEAMGFSTSMFTPIFALSRTVGWISQWKEMIADPEQKIGRPRQLYVGAPRRDYVEVEDR